MVRRAVRTGEIISGITTAASIFATAAIGAAAGAGLLARFHNDEEPYRDDDTAVLPDTTSPADRDQQTSPASDDVGPASAAYRRPG